MGDDAGKVFHILLALESFGGLTIGLKTAEADGLYLAVFVGLPPVGRLCGDDQIFIVVLATTEPGKQDQQQGCGEWLK